MSNYTDIKNTVQGLVGFISRIDTETDIEDPVVIDMITPDDDSVGFLETRWSAASADGGGIDARIGIYSTGYKKTGGAVTLIAPAQNDIDPGSGVLTLATLSIDASGGDITITVTGITQSVSWSLIKIFNSATAQITA